MNAFVSYHSILWLYTNFILDCVITIIIIVRQKATQINRCEIRKRNKKNKLKQNYSTLKDHFTKSC